MFDGEYGVVVCGVDWFLVDLWIVWWFELGLVSGGFMLVFGMFYFLLGWFGWVFGVGVGLLYVVWLDGFYFGEFYLFVVIGEWICDDLVLFRYIEWFGFGGDLFRGCVVWFVWSDWVLLCGVGLVRVRIVLWIWFGWFY